MDYLLNVSATVEVQPVAVEVLNLIINGLPSKRFSWGSRICPLQDQVLNLIINGLPSKLQVLQNTSIKEKQVLNLIINGLPSKLLWYAADILRSINLVLNLIINGLPSKLNTFKKAINNAKAIEF